MEQALIAAVAGFVGGRGGRFLDEVLKPTATLIGEDLATKYRSWRARNIADVLNTAAEMRETSGLAVAPVPGRLLFPILEHASVEEDEELRRRWSALLAKAGTAGLQDRLLPGYAEVLRQLTPLEAEILDWLYRLHDVVLSENRKVWGDVLHTQVEKQFGLTFQDYNLLMADLHRLQLIDGRRHVESAYGGTWTSASVYSTIGLTTLGIAFVEACKFPT